LKKKYQTCIEVLEEYQNTFKVVEQSIRKQPYSLTRKERAELVFYQEMNRNIEMIKSYIETGEESIDWTKWA
jgi:hypothetical protein